MANFQNGQSLYQHRPIIYHNNQMCVWSLTHYFMIYYYL